jgi:hypothetical protein
MSRPDETAVTVFAGAGVALLAMYVSETETYTVQVQQLPMFPWDEPVAVSHEEGLSAAEVVVRLQIANARNQFWGRGEEVPDALAEVLDAEFNAAAAAAGHPTLPELLGDDLADEAEEYLKGF